MIIIIAPEKDIANEIEILTQLFQEGLQYYHFRKPNKNYQEHCNYLNQIDPQYHNRIIVHYFHELINAYNLKGIHFQEQKRIELESSKDQNLKSYLKKLLTRDFAPSTISSSFHAVDVVKKCNFEFDYHLLSPVFSSISKKGYEGRGFDVNTIDKTIIGMGGVTMNNLSEFDKLGFHGVGVLGGIWNSDAPITDFKTMQNHFTQSKTYS